MEFALRRTLMLAFAGVAVAAFLVAVVVTILAPANALGWLVAALVVLALALVGEVVVLFLNDEGPHKPRRVPGTEPGSRQGPASVEKGDDLLLRCSHCSKTFTTFDTGARPLPTLCPHCGQRGVIDAPAA